jgi:hypothetical protein
VSVAYVACTRARDQVLAARCDEQRFLRKDQSTDRWILPGHQKWMTFGFEVRGLDSVPIPSDAVGLDGDLVGSEVMCQVNPRASDLRRPIYDLEVNGRTLARTTANFGELLLRRIRSARKEGAPWPQLSGLVVESLETRVVVSDDGAPQLVVAPRVSGMASLDWVG